MIALVGLTTCSGSLNDMMTIQDTDEDSSEDEGEGGDEDASEGEDV